MAPENRITQLKINKFLSWLLSRFLNGGTPAQFFKYIVSGILAAGGEYLFFYLLYTTARLWHIYANTIAMTAGFLLSFFLNRNWSFKSAGSIGRQFVLFLLLFSINLGISNGLMYLLSDILQLTPMISKVLTMGMIAAWNFVIYKKLIFRK